MADQKKPADSQSAAAPLLACPFCGGRAVERDDEAPSSKSEYLAVSCAVIQCEHDWCGAEIRVPLDDDLIRTEAAAKANARSRWQRRAG